jgi:hypothetical protein
VEQNEKTLDIKLGSGPERADGGRDRGAGEGGRGRGERRGRGKSLAVSKVQHADPILQVDTVVGARHEEDSRRDWAQRSKLDRSVNSVLRVQKGFLKLHIETASCITSHTLAMATLDPSRNGHKDTAYNYP